MEKLELYIPKPEDLWFYQKMTSDQENMSYNAVWTRLLPIGTTNG